MQTQGSGQRSRIAWPSLVHAYLLCDRSSDGLLAGIGASPVKDTARIVRIPLKERIYLSEEI